MIIKLSCNWGPKAIQTGRKKTGQFIMYKTPSVPPKDPGLTLQFTTTKFQCNITALVSTVHSTEMSFVVCNL